MQPTRAKQAKQSAQAVQEVGRADSINTSIGGNKGKANCISSLLHSIFCCGICKFGGSSDESDDGRPGKVRAVPKIVVSCPTPQPEPSLSASEQPATSGAIELAERDVPITLTPTSEAGGLTWKPLPETPEENPAEDNARASPEQTSAAENGMASPPPEIENDPEDLRYVRRATMDDSVPLNDSEHGFNPESENVATPPTLSDEEGLTDEAYMRRATMDDIVSPSALLEGRSSSFPLPPPGGEREENLQGVTIDEAIIDDAIASSSLLKKKTDNTTTPLEVPQAFQVQQHQFNLEYPWTRQATSDACSSLNDSDDSDVESLGEVNLRPAFLSRSLEALTVTYGPTRKPRGRSVSWSGTPSLRGGGGHIRPSENESDDEQRLADLQEEADEISGLSAHNSPQADETVDWQNANILVVGGATPCGLVFIREVINDTRHHPNPPRLDLPFAQLLVPAQGQRRADIVVSFVRANAWDYLWTFVAPPLSTAAVYRLILRAMRKTNCKRIIAFTSRSYGTERRLALWPQTKTELWFSPPQRWRYQHIPCIHRSGNAAIARLLEGNKHNLEWTALITPRVTDGPALPVWVGFMPKQREGLVFTMHKESLAQWILHEIEDRVRVNAWVALIHRQDRPSPSPSEVALERDRPSEQGEPSEAAGPLERSRSSEDAAVSSGAILLGLDPTEYSEPVEYNPEQAHAPPTQTSSTSTALPPAPQHHLGGRFPLPSVGRLHRLFRAAIRAFRRSGNSGEASDESVVDLLSSFE
ncbi:hypothetical protein BU16DRAFT_566691 [Lophium mytilinum]|uniref:NAD(P)-binding domain-containing protein n=1 Tax=Lophium mytilinum TaxID=390894 RepID=A0A6A6QAT2_9PEZI|nr:hypothetical protein BU16DRAFT_566691 [Lophium mytilinum]